MAESLSELLNEISDGRVTVEDALPEYGRLLKRVDPERPEESTFETREERALVDKDSTGTFTEVHAAYITGRISSEQFKTLYDATVGTADTENPDE